MASAVGQCLRRAVVVATRPSTASLSSKCSSRTPAYRPMGQIYRQFSVTPQSLIRRYTQDHEWIDLKGDKGDGREAVIGITEYAAEQLGDVVYVELPSEGNSYNTGDPIGAVESVKSAADINAPVKCIIKHVNLLLEEKPSTLNRLPEDDSAGGGWLAKVQIGSESSEEVAALMSEEEYKKFIAADES